MVLGECPFVLCCHGDGAVLRFRAQELRGAKQTIEDAIDAELHATVLVRKLAGVRRQATTHVSDKAVERAKAKEAAATAACTAAKAKLQDLLDTMNAHRCDAFPEVQFFMCVQSLSDRGVSLSVVSVVWHGCAPS